MLADHEAGTNLEYPRNIQQSYKKCSSESLKAFKKSLIFDHGYNGAALYGSMQTRDVNDSVK